MDRTDTATEEMTRPGMSLGARPQVAVRTGSNERESNTIEGAPRTQVVADRVRGDETDVEAQRNRRLRDLGVYTAEGLQQALSTQVRGPELIEGLIRTASVNLLVGDSGLGKTPLAIQAGVCVASATPLFGLRIGRPGRVLYCDAESDLTSFSETLLTVSRYVGLRDVPEHFHVWSPNWETHVSMNEAVRSMADRVISRAHVAEPALVIVDPLRVFWPNVEKGPDETVAMISKMRQVSTSTGCSWLLIHHRRKVNQQIGVTRLQDEPQLWFQEAAGSHALVNQTDSRIGVVSQSGQADLLLAGFVRGTGPFVPLDVGRVLNANGDPLGYRLLTGVEQLNEDDRKVFDKLDNKFRFKDVMVALGGTSGSNAHRFVRKCGSLQIVRKEGPDYLKTARRVESMEGME
jgi:hypothetical protein